jgi:hypothetical protein
MACALWDPNFGASNVTRAECRHLGRIATVRTDRGELGRSRLGLTRASDSAYLSQCCFGTRVISHYLCFRALLAKVPAESSSTYRW